MLKNLLLSACVLLSLLNSVLLVQQNRTPDLPPTIRIEPLSIDRMPIVSDHPLASYASQTAPVPQRGVEFKKYLAPSLKIIVSWATGSGTIVYYDPKENWAYVQTCGHLWDGNMSGTNRREITCRVQTWYHNDQKLSEPQTYSAEVLWYSNQRGQDSGLLRFHPDWQPEFFPIAAEDYEIQSGQHLHSIGCDHGTEVAHYDVEVVGLQSIHSDTYAFDEDLITRQNSPRPGRSGGGLISEDGYYVGICWGTSDKSGRGIGLFTPLKTVRSMNERNGYGWLNEIGISQARKLPIRDRNNPQGDYPKDYIPLPNEN